ncbi:MAG TPA: C4-type zinc ribbon domain-containing protein [Desulfobacterales bacterium]|nr:C4-type zinc ribbon domain-containing protein [Desulfobacterales bacterium]
MREQIEVLVKLQQIETETVQIKSALNDVSKRLEDLDSEVKIFEQTIEEQEHIINDLKKQYRDYESNIQLNLEKEQKIQAKLRSVKNNKEYQALLKEIEDVRGKNSETEDKMIEFLDRMDITEKIIATKKDEYINIFERAKSEKESIKQNAEARKKRLAELDMESAEVSGLVDPEFLKRYLIIKEQDPGELAVVPVKDAVCHGCNVNIPPQLYNELFRCDSLRFCPNCQRIIYYIKPS